MKLIYDLIEEERLGMAERGEDGTPAFNTPVIVSALLWN
jgi:hypothetical protein